MTVNDIKNTHTPKEGYKIELWDSSIFFCASVSKSVPDPEGDSQPYYRAIGFFKGETTNKLLEKLEPYIKTR